MKKTTVSIFIASLLSIGVLASCGNKNNKESTPASEESTYSEPSEPSIPSEPETNWPGTSIRQLFDLYGFEGYDIPPFEVDGATYELSDDSIYNDKNSLTPRYGVVKVRDIFRSSIDAYFESLSSFGWEYKDGVYPQKSAMKVTDNGTAYIFVTYDAVDISGEVIFSLRKDGEELHKWPEYIIRKYLTSNVKETVVAYAGQSKAFDLYIHSDGRLAVYASVNNLEESLQTYILALRKANWTIDGKEDGYWDRYVSPNKEICVTPTGFSWGEQFLTIYIESLKGQENPSENSESIEESNNNSESTTNSEESNNSENSNSDVTPQEGNWPEASINKSFSKHNVSDPFPSINFETKWIYEEIESGHTWFTLTTTVRVDTFNNSPTYNSWRSTLNTLGYHYDSEDSSYTRSPSDQFMFTFKPTFTSDHENYEIVITVMEVY